MIQEYGKQLATLSPMLLNYAFKFCRNADNAADLCSETICRVLEHIDQYDPAKSALASFCYATMRNVFITDYNRRKLWADFAVNYRPPTITDSDGITHDYAVIRSECRRKELLMLADGFSIDEIAEAQGIPTGTAKTRIFYERERLAAFYNYNASTAKPKKRRGRPPGKKSSSK